MLSGRAGVGGEERGQLGAVEPEADERIASVGFGARAEFEPAGEEERSRSE